MGRTTNRIVGTFNHFVHAAFWVPLRRGLRISASCLRASEESQLLGQLESSCGFRFCVVQGARAIVQIGILKLRKEIFTFDAPGTPQGVHGAVQVMIHGIGDAEAGMQVGIVGVLRASLLESCDEVLQLLLGNSLRVRQAGEDSHSLPITC
jgi:hypothetical protein